LFTHTGGSSGIGAVTAIHFSTLGCKIAITARSSDGLEKTAQECRKHVQQNDVCTLQLTMYLAVNYVP
jgi:NADP-dependent 3-hydroxy acid dehydrogenase YdfG